MPRLATAATLLAVLTATLVLTHTVSAQGMPRRTQSITLKRGWNAVYLEVMPANPGPASVFAGAPVSIVATYLNTESTVQFIRDPATIGWKKEGWGVWYSSRRPDSFLSTLHAVDGNRAYLIQADRDFTWTVEGYAELARVTWKADSYNFVGFTLDPQSPPTFEKFFGGSKAHRQSRLFRLVNDQWSLVTNPASTVMNPGEAFWISCQGSSDYQGPLRVTSIDGNRLSFGDQTQATLTLANESLDPATVQVETIGATPGIPLAYAVNTITDVGPRDVDYNLPPIHPVGTLEPSAKIALRLRVWRDRMTTPVSTTLLRIDNGAGSVVWVPVSAHRGDLSTTATPGTTTTPATSP